MVFEAFQFTVDRDVIISWECKNYSLVFEAKGVIHGLLIRNISYRHKRICNYYFMDLIYM